MKFDEETKDAIYEFLFNCFADNTLGLSKFTSHVGDIIVGDNTIDIAFDFRPYTEEVTSGLSGKTSKIKHPTPTEVEVTEKHVDNFMVNDFPSTFFRKRDEYPTFRLQPVEHRWDENGDILYCLYDVIRLPRYQRRDRIKDRSI